MGMEKEIIVEGFKAEIERLKQRIKHLEAFQMKCGVCHQRPANHREVYGIGNVYSCDECYEQEMAVRERKLEGEW